MYYKKTLKILFVVYFTIFNLPISTVNGRIVIQGPPCCLGENIVRSETVQCINNEINIQLKCEHGKYLVDSKSEPYEILGDGNLLISNSFSSSEMLVGRESYCSTHLLNDSQPNLPPEIRKVVLICFTPSSSSTWILFLIKGILSFISVIFLIATIFVYWLIPDLRETQDKVTYCALVCLIIFFTFLGINQLNNPDTLGIACVPIAFLVYFFSIAYFTWLNLIMINVWKSSVKPKWKIKERQWYRLNHLYGWTVPLTLVLAVFTAHHSDNGLEPGFGEISCWFENKLETWTFLYLPISIMLLINVVLVIWSSYGLHKHGNDISLDKKKALSYKCKLYLKLFLIAGLTWITEVISYHFSSSVEDGWYWLILDAINALHGVLIFIVLVISRRRIRRALAGQQILCIKLPESWANVNHVEEEELNKNIEDNSVKCDLIVK